MYVIGDYEVRGKYDATSATWTPIAPMGNARVAHRVAVVNDTIYAIGGSDSNSLSSVEKYDVVVDCFDGD